MITIMSQIWQKDSRYLKEFILHHSLMGVEFFVFILDEYELPFDFKFPESSHYKVLCVKGTSGERSLSRRQIENYNYYLDRVKTEYVLST